MDITQLFKSKARKALFRLYFTNPESAHYLRELERILNMPVSIIRKELMRLQAQGVFLSENKGNLLYYRLDTAYPFFEELRNIVRKTVGVEGLLKDAIAHIKNIDIAFIYGSFARGEEKSASDVDLFICGRINEDMLISKIGALEKLLKREINYTIFSPEEYRKKKKNKDSFILDLINNKKIMLKGEENDLR